MTIPKTGRVTLAQIQGEFRAGSNSAPHCISEYYRDGVNVPDIVENNGVPTRGTICFSDFYGSSDQVRPNSITLPPIDVDDFWQETAEVNNWTDIQDNWRQHVTRINDRHAVAVDIRSPAALVDVWSGNATRGVEVNLETEVGASSNFEKLLRNTQENKDYFEFGEWSLTIPAKFTRFRIVATAGGGSGSVQKTELSGDFLLDTTLPATEESGYKGGDARIISENGTVELYGAPGGQDPDGVPDTQIVPEQGQHTVRNNGTVTGDFVKITPTEVDHPAITSETAFTLQGNMKHTITIIGGGGGGGSGGDDWKGQGTAGTAGTGTIVQWNSNTKTATGGSGGRGGKRGKSDGGSPTLFENASYRPNGQKGENSSVGTGGAGGVKLASSIHGKPGGNGGRAAGGGGGSGAVNWRTGYGGEGGKAGASNTFVVDLIGKSSVTLNVTQVGQGGAGGPKDGGSTQAGAGGKGGNGYVKVKSQMASNKNFNVQFYWNNAVKGSFFSNRHAGSSKHELETTNWQYETQSQISTANGIRYYAVLRTPIVADSGSSDNPSLSNDPNWTVARSDIMKVVGGEKTEKGEGKRLAEFPDEAVYAAQLVVEGASTLRGQEALSDFGEGKHPINMFFRWGLAQGKVHSADGSTGRGGHSLYGSGTEAAQEYPNLSGPSGTPAFGAGGGPGQHGGRGSNSLGWTNTYGGYAAATAYLGDFETAPGEIITIKVPQGGKASRNEYTDVYNNEGERFVSKSDRGGDGIVQIYGQHGPSFSMMSHAGIVLMDDTGRVLKSLVTNGVSDKGTNTNLPNRTNKLSVLLPGSDDPENPRRYYIGYTARIKKNGKFQTKMGFKSPGATINVTPNYVDTANELPVQSLYHEPDWHSADEIAIGTKGVRDGPDLEDVPNWFIRKCNVKFDITTTGSTAHQLIFKKVASSDAEIGPAQISISNGSVTAEVGYDEIYKLVTSGIGISPNKTVTVKTRSKDGKLQVGHDNFSSIKLSATAFSSSNSSERHGNFYVQDGITYWSCSKETSSGTTEGTSASFAVAVPTPVTPVVRPSNNDNDGGGSSGSFYSHYEPSTGTTTNFSTGMTHEQIQDLRKQQPGGVFSTNTHHSGDNISDQGNESTGGSVSDQSQGGGCFLTTAVVEMRGEADDGTTLNTLRIYRDNFLLKNYPNEIEEYYNIAPKIVAAIPKTHTVWNWVGEQIDLSISHINRQEDEKAYLTYKNMVRVLENDWLKDLEKE